MEKQMQKAHPKEFLQNNFEALPQIHIKNVKEQKGKDGNSIIVIQFSQSNGLIKQFLKYETNLNLSKSKITDQQMRSLSQLLPNLTELTLNQCEFLKSLKLNRCRKLQKIEMTCSNNIADIILEQMPALKQVDLGGCSQLQSIKFSNCFDIIKLSLNETKLSDDNLKQIIQEFSNLQQINLMACEKLRDFQCLAKLKKLKSLNLIQTFIQDHQINAILQQTNQLQQLYLKECYKIQNLQLNQCKKLKVLNLDLLKLQHQSFNQIIQQLPQLEILSLFGWKQIDLGKVNLLSCPKLKELYLSDNHKLTIEIFDKLGQELPLLQRLSFQNCYNLKNISLKNFHNLIFLDIIQSVNKQTVQALKSEFPHIKILSS